MEAKLTLGRMWWRDLVRELRRRGDGVRESGAFILAPREAVRATRFVCYDELDPNCLDAGFIRLPGRAYVALTEICEQSGLRVIADVHTHPGRLTGQSPSDRSHPMMARAGHIALIVPSYARSNELNLAGVGAFEYLGNGRWRGCQPEIHLSLL